ncbi:hypothetical protein BDQ94DRAFT_163945 [Aspergillus welwitschiae]|uniref:Uncharacterized protein n=1 Tax=Aspergillus welwitschiae TaxID=1341132 RepID=A0A3F3PK41_9EURO|nr:hypothetical protein BDQ94DRAFT_163945 [Aspergillus welwitschiae]RDH27082.1 hypothetical protein BDQ94DRAFT_163945 [Aspergillus welwitschiae]
MDIPVTVERLIVYAILLNDIYYVCGVGFIACDTESFIGSKTGSLRIINICHPQLIKYGLLRTRLESEYLGCGEEISLRHSPRRLRISHNINKLALKFRHLSWLHHNNPFSEETLLVRNEHPSRSSQNVLKESFIFSRIQHRRVN